MDNGTSVTIGSLICTRVKLLWHLINVIMKWHWRKCYLRTCCTRKVRRKSQKNRKRSGINRSAFRREPELTQKLAPAFWDRQWVFCGCDDSDGLLLLFSLATPSRCNKGKYCLVKSSSWNCLEAGFKLRNCSTEAKKLIKEVEVDQKMMPNKWNLKSWFPCPPPPPAPRCWVPKTTFKCSNT